MFSAIVFELVSLNNYIYTEENDHHKNQYVRIFALKINLNLFLIIFTFV